MRLLPPSPASGLLKQMEGPSQTQDKQLPRPPILVSPSHVYTVSWGLWALGQPASPCTCLIAPASLSETAFSHFRGASSRSCRA